MEVRGAEDVSITACRRDISLPEGRESVGLSGSGSEPEAEISDIQTTPGRLKHTPIRESTSFSLTSLSQSRNPHQAAELIHARSRILQLEGEVLGLQRAAKRARIEGEEKEAGKSLGEQLEQLHKVVLCNWSGFQDTMRSVPGPVYLQLFELAIRNPTSFPGHC